MLSIRNNKDLLTIKVFGYSNLKFFYTRVKLFHFRLGCAFFANPITSSMSKYYEKTKSSYSRDIDHLVNFNKNGLWIKENTKNNTMRIISAAKPEGVNLIDLTIFHFDSNSNLIEKIISKKTNIKNNEWILNDVLVFKPKDGVLEKKEYKNYSIISIYDYEKITNLFKNFDTLSFLDLILNYQNLENKGYNKEFLNQSLHSMLTLPFFIFNDCAIICADFKHVKKI